MSNILKDLFNIDKPVIGMAHFKPLPGNYLYSNISMETMTELLFEDIIQLQKGGVDGIMFCNEDDRPYSFKADPGTIAAMAYCIGKLKDSLKVPFGVDILWDPVAALALAKVTGAKFVREIFTGVFESDMGMWNTNCSDVFKYRRLINAEDIKLFFNINGEFASKIGQRTVPEIAQSVSVSSLPDVILVSGSITGFAAPLELYRKIKELVKNVPVLINTGINQENVSEIMSIVDGAIVGTAFKTDGITWNPVKKENVERIMEKVKKLRESM